MDCCAVGANADAAADLPHESFVALFNGILEPDWHLREHAM